MMDRLFDVAGLIVLLGLATTLVAHKNTAADINAVGGVFTNSMRAAMGH